MRRFVEEEAVPDAISLSRPRRAWTYDPHLALREAIHRNNGGVSRSVDEVAALDPAWEHDVATAWAWYKFHRDALSNPWMQG